MLYGFGKRSFIKKRIERRYLIRIIYIEEMIDNE